MHSPPAGGPGPHRGRVPAFCPHGRRAVPAGGTPRHRLGLGGHACADGAAPHPGRLRPPRARGRSGCFGRCGVLAHSCQALMADLSGDVHPASPMDPTILSTVLALPALSQSAHRDRRTEASETLHRTYATNGPRPPIGEGYYACPPITRINALSCRASTRWGKCAAKTAPVPGSSVRRVVPSADARTISPNNGRRVTGAGA